MGGCGGWAAPAAALLLIGLGPAEEKKPGPYGDISDLKLLKPEDKKDVEGTPPPKGAVVLFDGKSLDTGTKTDGKAPAAGKLVDGCAADVNGSGHIITKEKFRGKFNTHAAFRQPTLPE